MKKVEMTILQEGLTYTQALYELVENGAYITRPQWLGYHFRYFDNYCVRLANGEIIVNPEDIYNKDRNDWMVIDLKDEEVLYVFEKLEKMDIECYLKEDEE